MGWQDRDYASPARGQGPRYRTLGTDGFGVFGAAGGRSIVTTLIIINVAVHFLASIAPNLGIWIYDYGAMQGRAVLHGQVWRLITAQYLHDNHSLMHLLFNMIGLHFLGRPLESMWSPRKFVAVYTLCGVCGNLFFTLLGVTGAISLNVPAVGASGCILGLLGVVAVLFPHARILLFFIIPMKIRTAAFLFAGIAYWTILQRGANYGGEACHLAGLGFGVWWAMKGDAWWSRSGRYWWSRITSRSSAAAQPKRKSQRGGFQARVEQRRVDSETIDRILKKVYDGGIHSLTEGEKQALQDATERKRQLEQEAGRVDRL
jgi:membrane associated rhomboid family serine protease